MQQESPLKTKEPKLEQWLRCCELGCYLGKLLVGDREGMSIACPTTEAWTHITSRFRGQHRKMGSETQERQP